MTSAVEYDWSTCTCLRKCRPYTTVCKLGYFLFLVISLKQWMQTCSVYILQKKSGSKGDIYSSFLVQLNNYYITLKE